MTPEDITQTLPPQAPVTRFLSTSTVKSGNWFRNSPNPERPSVLDALVKLLVGVAIGALAFAWGAENLAFLIWIVAGVVGVVTLSSQKGRTGIGKLFVLVWRGVGWALGVVLLTPLYLIGFTTARVVGRIAGRDPLQLRDTKSQTF